MKIEEIIKNPLVKLAGIITILYFALFTNKENPDSMGNRFSSEQLKKDFNDIKEKSKLVTLGIAQRNNAQNIAKDETINKTQENLTSSDSGKKIELSENIYDFSKFIVNDSSLGDISKKSDCGNEVVISYQIYSEKQKLLQNAQSKTLIIGAKEDLVLEKYSKNMGKKGIRAILFPQDFISNNSELNKLANDYGNLWIKITLLEITAKSATQIDCSNL